MRTDHPGDQRPGAAEGGSDGHGRTRSLIARWPFGPGPTVIVLAFAVSRALALLAGVRMDTDLLTWAWQLLDVELLRESPVESIFWLHSQPPGFNLLTAALLQIPERFFTSAVFVLWSGMSLGGALALYGAMRQAQVRRPIAVTTTVLFLVSPASLLYSAWFFYSELIVFLLAVALFFVTRFSYTLQPLHLAALSGSLAALSLTKASYHPLLVAVLLAAFWLARRVSWRRAYVVALLPLLFPMAWMVKNGAVFGSFTTSTWLGMNMTKQYSVAFTAPEQRFLVEEDVVQEAPRSFLPALDAASGLEPGSRGTPATDAWRKANGHPNYNNTVYIEVSRRSQADVLRAFWYKPSRYVRVQAAAHVLWLEPADGLPIFFRDNRSRIRTYADWFDRTVLLRLGRTGANAPRRLAVGQPGTLPFWQEAVISISWTKVAMYGLAVGGGVALVRRKRRSGDRRAFAVWTFTFGAYASILLASNAIEFGENMRFSYESMPALLLLAALGIEQAARRWLPHDTTANRSDLATAG